MSLPPSYNLLEKYPNNHYIETGTWRGDSIQLAIEAGFKNITGIELDQQMIDSCNSRFALHHNITLVKGDSAICLESVMAELREPATIFLDAHSQLLENEADIINPFPLLQELQQIANHKIKKHTIIIDDLLVLTHPHVTGWNRATIINAVRSINPRYQINLIANPVRENILIASI